jgi:hypothetical protein
LPTTTAQLGVNTNLEQISDWLTKIIVGLGLINLEKLPQKFKAIASAAAPTVGGSRSFAAVIIVAYSVCGFMLGYLLTRLYLARAFVRAERAQEAAADIHRELERVGAEAAITTAPAAADTDPISPQQKVAAARVERLAMKTDADAVRLQVERLAREYERIRGSMSPGDARTRLMEIVAAQMRTLSLAGHELLPELIHSNTGERLAAVSFLEVKPSAEHLQWLVERMTEENPFVMYHAAWALRHAARVLPCSELDSVKSAITRAMTAAMGKDRGTESVLKQAATEASKRCLHEPAEE